MRADLLHILQHSLGLDEYGQGTSYRNHFVADRDDGNGASCLELVAMGLMVEHPPREIFGGMSCFVVTELGREAVREQSPKPPKLSRSKQRYQRYLRSGADMSFREWLSVHGGQR